MNSQDGSIRIKRDPRLLLSKARGSCKSALLGVSAKCDQKSRLPITKDMYLDCDLAMVITKFINLSLAVKTMAGTIR